MVLPSGKIAVVDGEQIKIYTRKGKYISLWQSGLYAIRDAVLLPSGDGIATITNFSIQVFDLYDHLLREWYPDLFMTAITAFASPSGESMIAVTDLDSRVEIYTIDGKLVHQWGRSGSREGEFNYPSGIVYLPSSEEIAIADRDRIQFFSLRPGSEGKFVRQWELSFAPKAISLFPGDRLMVAHRYCIRIFSLEGECVHYWTHYDQHNISTLEDAAMIGDNKMVIVDLQGSFRIKTLRIQMV